MPFLLIYREDQQPFVVADALATMRAIGVSDIAVERMPGALISGHYGVAGDSVIVELKIDRQTFAVSDCSPAGLKFALDLQSAVLEPLHMIDEGYSFDVILNDYGNLDDLRSALELELHAPS
jgi:hypothetical protein